MTCVHVWEATNDQPDATPGAWAARVARWATTPGDNWLCAGIAIVTVGPGPSRLKGWTTGDEALPPCTMSSLGVKGVVIACNSRYVKLDDIRAGGESQALRSSVRPGRQFS